MLEMVVVMEEQEERRVAGTQVENLAHMVVLADIAERAEGVPKCLKAILTGNFAFTKSGATGPAEVAEVAADCGGSVLLVTAAVVIPIVIFIGIMLEGAE